MELVKARQDLYRFIICETVDANGATVHVEVLLYLVIFIRKGLILISTRSFSLVLIGGKGGDYDLNSLCGLPCVIVIQLRKHIIIILVEISTHSLQLKHLQIGSQQHKMIVYVSISVHATSHSC